MAHEYMTTPSGLEFAAVTDEGYLEGMDGYDRTVAQGQLMDYGAFFIGRFDDVLDNQYEVEEACRFWRASKTQGECTVVKVKVTRTAEVTVGYPGTDPDEVRAALDELMRSAAFAGKVDGRLSREEGQTVEFEQVRCSPAEASGADFPLEKRSM